MKRFACRLGSGEGEGARKVTKSTVGEGNNASGSFAPDSRISSGMIGGPNGLKLPGRLSPLNDDDDDYAEDKGGGGGEGGGAREVTESRFGKGDNAGGSFAPDSRISSGMIGGPNGLKLPGRLSPLSSDDDDDDEAKGGGGGARAVTKCTVGEGDNAGGSFAPDSRIISSGMISGPNGLQLPGRLHPLRSDDDDDAEAQGGGGGEGEGRGGKGCGTQEDDDEDEDEGEERMDDLELGKYKSDDDPKRLLQILASFTPEQTSRFECYRRTGFKRTSMRRLLEILAGCPISIPITIVMSGISKMFVGELVEIGRIVMTERQDVGPIKPCHIREAYRRLKLEGKVPSRWRAPRFR